MTINQFERHKFLRNKKNLVIFILLFLGVVLYYPFLNRRFENERQSNYDVATSDFQQLNQLSNLKNINKRDYELYEQAMNSLDKYWGLNKSERWKQALKEENKYLEALIVLEKNKAQIPTQKEDLARKINSNNLYLKNNSRPMTPDFGLTAVYYFFIILTFLGTPLLLLLTLLFGFDFFTKEFEEDTINFLAVQTCGTRPFFAAKKRLLFVTTMGIFFLSLSLSYAIGFFFSGRAGSLSNITLYSLSSNRTMSLWKYLGLILVSQISFLPIMIEFLSYCSKKMWNAKKVFAIVGLVCIGLPLFLFDQFQNKQWLYFVPFTQLNVSKMIQLQYSKAHFNVHIFIWLCLAFLIDIFIIFRNRNQQKRTSD